jgi:GT2 family glycosyltransferase
MKITVVVPNYNGERFLAECFDALKRQTFDGFESILVDNASADGSMELMRERYPEVRCIRMRENTGFAAAVNAGVAASEAPFVALLNNDAIPEPGWLEALYRCFAKKKRVFSVSSKMIQYNDRTAIDDAGDGLTVGGNAFQRGHGSHVRRYRRDARVFSSCGGAALYRRETLLALGGFDERFFAYLEDVDIGFRARLHGYINVYCANAVVHHIGSATSSSMSGAFKLRLSARNNIVLIHKNMPPWMRRLNAPFLAGARKRKEKSYRANGFGAAWDEGVFQARAMLGDIKPEYEGTRRIHQTGTWLSMWASTFRIGYYKGLRRLLGYARRLAPKRRGRSV